ncbi:hypothetical protein D9619_012819 [Psilocybe cf. subviscida]|uniref:Uncharacterized protein n=1 Tax=Psilocybe cf. subviscida TaxID=2480587 RepID=A0A8H5AQI5_9AGAR|nr:hypothetical protein D9619_012819 [Psilocybe cf. subviscida]
MLDLREQTQRARSARDPALRLTNAISSLTICFSGFAIEVEEGRRAGIGWWPFLEDLAEARLRQINTDWTMTHVERIRNEYPPTIEFDGPTVHSCMKRWEGKTVATPIYSAGFLLNPQWLETIYMPRIAAGNHREILSISVVKHGDDLKKHLHRTTSVISYYDHDGHRFFNLCDNSPSNAHTRDAWLERRDEHLKAICEALEFTLEEIEQAQKNFKWYMTTPAGIMQVPLDMTVHGSMTDGRAQFSG